MLFPFIKDRRLLVLVAGIGAIVLYNTFLLLVTYTKNGNRDGNWLQTDDVAFKNRASGERSPKNGMLVYTERSDFVTVKNNFREVNEMYKRGQLKTIDRKQREKAKSFDKQSKSTDLLELHSVLMNAWRLSRGAKASEEIRKALRLTERIIGRSPRTDELFGGKVFKSKFVCPEQYISHTVGYPYFYKGFEITKCSITLQPASYISLLIYFPKISLNTVKSVIKNIRRNYTTVSIYIAGANVGNEIAKEINDKYVEIITVDRMLTEGEVWNVLVKKARTEFVLIGRDLVLFDAFDARLERLVRVIDELQISVSSGSRRGVVDGIWTNGCFQSTVKNYTLSYLDGYDRSALECLFCDYSSGPFVARKSLLQSFLFSNFDGDILFRDFFLRLQQSEKIAVSCPDSMFFTSAFSETLYNSRETWLPLVRKHKINKVRAGTDIEFDFTCDESHSDCSKSTGIALAPCCLQHLADAVNGFMKICRSVNIICELQEGTLLGAVKFNAILPWERDADLTFLTANFSVLAAQGDAFTRLGMSSSFDKNALWCCVDGVQAGGKGMVNYKNWHMEIYGQHRMDSQLLKGQGLSPTRLSLDGKLVAVPRNPGLHARNRYGQFIYGHVQHWMSIGGSSGWIDYEPSRFTECTSQRSSDCLDQYFVDGNIQFRNVIP